MMNKLVSIIIPTYNRLNLLKRAIDSVYKQTYKNWEIIIIDNYSTDGTDLFIQGLCCDKKIKYEKYQNKGIIGASRNLGIKYSSGYYIAFLDSDDWWNKEKLTISTQVLHGLNSDISYHNCYIKGEGISRKTHSRRLASDSYSDLLLNGNTLVTSSVVAKRSVVNSVGGFSEDPLKVGWEDYDLWIKISKQNSKFKFIDLKLANYWIGEDKFDNPDRVLLNINRMLETIIQEYESKEKAIPWWPNYTQAIAYRNKNELSIARKLFLKVIFSHSPLKSKFKSLFNIIKLNIKTN